VPIPPIGYISETLPKSEVEALEAEQDKLDGLSLQLSGAEKALDKEKAARREQMAGIRSVGTRTTGFNELLALAVRFS